MASDTGSQFEVDEDSEHQQVEWRFEQAGWLVGTLLLVAALIGLLGSGPLSSQEEAAGGGVLSVSFNRFIRYQSEASMQVRIAPAAVQDGAIRLRVSALMARSLAVEAVQPPPNDVVMTGEELIAIFPAQPAQKPILIEIQFRPSKLGFNQYSIGLDGGPAVAIRTFTFP